MQFSDHKKAVTRIHPLYFLVQRSQFILLLCKLYKSHFQTIKREVYEILLIIKILDKKSKHISKYASSTFLDKSKRETYNITKQ